MQPSSSKLVAKLSPELLAEIQPMLRAYADMLDIHLINLGKKGEIKVSPPVYRAIMATGSKNYPSDIKTSTIWAILQGFNKIRSTTPLNDKEISETKKLNGDIAQILIACEDHKEERAPVQGDIIRERIEALGLHDDQVGAHFNVTDGTVQNWKRGDITAARFKEICEGLGIDEHGKPHEQVPSWIHNAQQTKPLESKQLGRKVKQFGHACSVLRQRYGKSKDDLVNAMPDLAYLISPAAVGHLESPKDPYGKAAEDARKGERIKQISPQALCNMIVGLYILDGQERMDKQLLHGREHIASLAKTLEDRAGEHVIDQRMKIRVERAMDEVIAAAKAIEGHAKPVRQSVTSR